MGGPLTLLATDRQTTRRFPNNSFTLSLKEAAKERGGTNLKRPFGLK